MTLTAGQAGRDFRCVDDFDERLSATDDPREIIFQAAYHRITNVSVYGDTDAHINFGIDVRTMLGAPDSDIMSAVDEAIQRDPRVLDTTTTITRVQGAAPDQVNYTLRIEIDSAAGPFDLVVAVSALTVDILEHL